MDGQMHAPSHERGPCTVSDLAEQFKVGRTLPRLLHLMEMHWFTKPVPFCEEATLRPRPGLSAMFESRPVFVVGSFARRDAALVDVMHLYAYSDTRRRFMDPDKQIYVGYRQDVQTVSASSLTDVGVSFMPYSSRHKFTATVDEELFFVPVEGQDCGVTTMKKCQLLASCCG